MSVSNWYYMTLNNAIQQGARLIRAGEVVAFPTETVYGLGADATNPEAIQKIYTIKGRPQNNPLIVHISDRSQLSELIQTIPPKAQILMDAFWPGPLTILFSKKDSVPSSITAGLDTIAVRMPSHPIALALIRAAGTPIVAPSANPSGKPSATHHNHISDYFGESLFCIPGGSPEIGIESTVVNILGDTSIILRSGAITQSDLEHVLGESVQIASHTDTQPLSPGMKYKHYAPNAPLKLIYDQSLFQQELDLALTKYDCVGVLGSQQLLSDIRLPNNSIAHNLGDRTDLSQISRNLFASLHAFDSTNVDLILVETFTLQGIGQAIMDKLIRASER